MKRDNFRLYRWPGLCVSVWRPCRLYANIYISVGCFSVTVRVFVSARAWFSVLFYEETFGTKQKAVWPQNALYPQEIHNNAGQE